MHQDTLLPTNGLRQTTWRIVLTLAAAWMASLVHGGEVTVVGSLWKSTPPSPYDDADVPLPPVAFPVGPPVTEKPPLLVFKDPPIESTFYMRADYYRWSRPRNNDNESTHCGTLSTLGFERRIGAEQFRGEMFGGNMLLSESVGYYVNSRHYTERAHGIVGYYGGRVEIEHLWNVGMEGWPPVTLFAGIGSRFWKENNFNQITDSGYHFEDWQEAWWTVYPYCGFRKEWDLVNGTTLFLTGRVGTTLLNYAHMSEADYPAFYPDPGITAQLECGWRDRWFSVSAYFETMGWQDSQGEHIHNDPTSQLYMLECSTYYTTGIKLGVTY